MTDFCDHGTDALCCIKWGEILQLTHLLKQDSYQGVSIVSYNVASVSLNAKNIADKNTFNTVYGMGVSSPSDPSTQQTDNV